MTSIALIDYGAGNLRSVAKAFEAVGSNITITSEPSVLAQCDKIVLPGVGSFGDGMAALREKGLINSIRQAVSSGKPFLGICLGMQLLLEQSEEMGRHQGLGLLPGEVKRFPDSELKVPHTGWNQLIPAKSSPLLSGVPAGSFAYFNHSYFCQPDPQVVAAETEYGLRFASALSHKNIHGLQFHPEKSQHIGLQMLRNFVEAVQ